MLFQPLRILSLATFCGMVSLASAVDFGVRMESYLEERLNPEARELYERALERFDHVDLENGIRLLSEASEAQPEHGMLQVFTYARAKDRAEVYYSAASYTPSDETINYSSPPWRTAEVYMTIMESSLERLSQITTLDAEQRDRLMRETKAFEEMRAELPQRDTDRLKTAETLMSEIYYQRMVDRGLIDLMPLAQDALGLAQEQAIADATGDEEEDTTRDPFADLLGEYIPDWLPTPQAQPQGQGVYGGQFGNPQLGLPAGVPGGFAPQQAGGAQGGGFTGGAETGGDPFGGGGGAPTGGNPFGGGGGAPTGGNPFGAAGSAPASSGQNPFNSGFQNQK